MLVKLVNFSDWSKIRKQNAVSAQHYIPKSSVFLIADISNSYTFVNLKNKLHGIQILVLWHELPEKCTALCCIPVVWILSFWTKSDGYASSPIKLHKRGSVKTKYNMTRQRTLHSSLSPAEYRLRTELIFLRTITGRRLGLVL